MLRATLCLTARYSAALLLQIIKGIAPQQMPPAPYTSGSIEEVIYLLVSFGDIQLQGLCVCRRRSCFGLR